MDEYRQDVGAEAVQSPTTNMIQYAQIIGLDITQHCKQEKDLHNTDKKADGMLSKPFKPKITSPSKEAS